MADKNRDQGAMDKSLDGHNFPPELQSLAIELTRLWVSVYNKRVEMKDLTTAEKTITAPADLVQVYYQMRELLARELKAEEKTQKL
ncbi:MAG: hypothetical protein K9N22_03205 [Candidatus Marinimicrobia bacterium]|nr:hypothetical protein [Candidatus Neomarinimicrobiota bacterium]